MCKWPFTPKITRTCIKYWNYYESYIVQGDFKLEQFLACWVWNCWCWIQNEGVNLKIFNSCTNSHFLWSSNSKLVHWSCPFWLLTCLLYFFPLFSLVFGSKLVSSRSNFIFFLFLTSFFLFFLGLCSNLMHFLYLVPFIFSQVFDFPFKHVWTILPSWLLGVLKFHPFYSSITPFNSR